ncbi:unnamed protein product [Spirodela intermedia]|uniref:Uncharacterized protein n=1 Tax=Spirodela intermedia TaxID=51605 RepID=A0A7I8IP33_SPIIN|nr:unnamed protein product [Spirodela intermedia]CAA6659569.1 unnamed protein product [Spirodela intermedia]
MRVPTSTAASALRHHRNNRVDALAAILQTCAAAASLSAVRQAHARVLRVGLHGNNSLAATLLVLYAALSPSPLPALQVFSSVPFPALSLFNRAIRAFSSGGSAAALLALRLYSQMPRRKISPDNFTIPFVLNSCASLLDLSAGGEAHSRAVRSGCMGFLPVPNALIDMYGKCGALESARRLFDEMAARDVVSYNALLGAHAKTGGDMASARRLFNDMPQRNVITWNAMLVGHVNGGDLRSARAVFDAMPARNVVSWTTMLVGYTKNRLLDEARVLFDVMPERNLISWTAMITGYAQNGRPHEALELFRAMDRAGVRADAVATTGAVSAVAQLGSADLAHWVAAYADRRGIERNQHLLTALVDMHAKCGSLEAARECFEQIPSPDSFAYSALINGLAAHGRGGEALKLFRRMQSGVSGRRHHLRRRAERLQPRGVGRRGAELLGRDGAAARRRAHGGALRLRGRHARARREAAGGARTHQSDAGGAVRRSAGRAAISLQDLRRGGIAEAVAGELFELEPENTGNYMLLWSIYAGRGRWADAERVREAMSEKGVKKLPGFCWSS